MKLLLLALTFTIGTIASQRASACSPPRQKYGLQAVQTRSLFANEDVEKTIYELAGEQGTVKSMTAGQGYTIVLSNECSFRAIPKYNRPQPGMCPQLLGFEIVEKACR